MEKDFKIAVVGFGGMGGWHCGKINEIEGMSLAGIYDIDPQRRKAAEEKGIHAYGSYAELLNDGEIDLVTVATPNDSHLPLVFEALKAGKNVVCEKPVALSSNELQQMIDCAKQEGKLFSVHQNRRWDEDFLTIKEICDKGTLGKVFNIESRVHGSRGIPGDWRTKKAHGGGMVLDWGVHLIDQILTMIPDKKITTLYAKLNYITCGEVDDGFRLIMEFDKGPSCLIEVGTSNFIGLDRWYMQGPNGTAIIRDWDMSGEIVMVSDWEKRDAIPVVTAAGLTKTMAPRTEETIKKFPLPVQEADIRDYYKNIRAVIKDGAELIVKPSQCMRVMQVMEKMFESAREDKVINEML